MTQYRPTREEFRRTLWRAALPPLLLLAALAAFVALLLFQLLRANTWAQRSEDVIYRSADLERLLVTMESGVRGYKLSGSEEFLKPYNLAKARVDGAFAEFEERVKDSPSQLDRVRGLKTTYDQWLAQEQKVRGADIRPADSDAIAVLRQRRVLMEDLRSQLQQINKAEAELRHDRYEDFRRATSIAVMGSIGVSMSLGIALALLNRGTIVRLSNIYHAALEAEDARSAELASSNRQFLDLAEAIPQLVWISDSEGKPVYFNGPWSAFCGSTVEQLTEQGWEGALHPEDRAAAVERWKESLTSGQPFEAEYRLKRQSDGEYRWFLCRSMPVRDRSGKNIRWFGSCTDIESQKQLEQQREILLTAERRARTDLLRTNMIKDQFLATLSHELRTPMTAILGWTQLLRDPVIRESNLERAIEAIDSNARTQARLIEDLLDMSRILSGKLTIKPEAVDLRNVLSAAIDAVGPAAHAKQVNIFQSVDHERDFHLRGDPARLQQVAWNILSNAVKFTPPEGEIRVSLSRVDGQAVLRIADSGRGITPEFLPHVFEQFRQADGSTTRKHGGLGLGLAIVKHLVEMHGGQVSAASEGEGKGATFTVQVPLVSASSMPTLTRRDDSKAGDFQHRLHGLKLLLVEDDRDSAVIVRTILEHAGATVDYVACGADALSRLKEQKYDLMVSDIGMPEMDGYGLIRRVREMEDGAVKNIPAIALTAFAHKDDRQEALSAGYQLHIAKPVAPEDLTRAVARVAKQDQPE
jgi:PAS domain S-box-containing protein